MGWGSPFKEAWKGASKSARAAAGAVATGTRWVGRQAHATYEWGKETAGRAVSWTQEMAEQVASWAKDKTRDGLRSIADGVFDAAGQAADTVQAIADGAKRAFESIRDIFGSKKPQDPAVECKAPSNDKEADGCSMAPLGDNTCAIDCQSSAAQARPAAQLSQSKCCQAKRAAGEPTRDIVYVNGINTSREDHCRTLHAIAEQTCGRVTGIYNATEGGPADAVQTSQDRRLIKAANDGKAAKTGDGRNKAVDAVSDFVIEEKRNGRNPEIWAHSQGGAVTSLALYDARNTLAAETGDPAPLDGLKVKSLAAAAPYWPDGPQYEHYVHVDDFTPSSFGLGHDGDEDGKRAGRGATVVRFSGEVGGPFNAKNPKKSWLPSPTAKHGVEDVYLKMEKQRNGGCP